MQQPNFKRSWWQFALSTLGIGCVLATTALFGDLDGRLDGFVIIGGVGFTMLGLLLVLAGATGHHALAVRVLGRFVADEGQPDDESRSRHSE